MPINQPKLTGDITTDAWTKSVTDNLNQLELDFETQLEVTDVRSSNWNGQDSVPSAILDEDEYPDLASREEVIGTEGYFLDASSAIITTQDVLVRGDIASANFQITTGTDGWFLDGESGRMFTGPIIARHDMANAHLANDYGGVGFTAIPDVRNITTPNAFGMDGSNGGLYASVGVAEQLYAGQHEVLSFDTDTPVHQIIFPTNPLLPPAGTTLVSPIVFAPSSKTNVGVDDGRLLPGGTYSVLFEWTDTDRPSENLSAQSQIMTFTLPPSGVDMSHSQDGDGNGILIVGEMYTRGIYLGELLIEYDGLTSDEIDIIKFFPTPTDNDIPTDQFMIKRIFRVIGGR